MKPLAKAFDRNALLYDEIRPEYPKAIWQFLQQTTGIGETTSVLEIGCGTGQATAGLIRLTRNITCLEPGENLIKIAAKKFPELQFVNCTFEDYQTEKRFDLLVSATAWHWIDEKIRYKKAHQLLKETGKLAIIYHYHIETDPDSFHLRAKNIYKKYLGSRDLSSRAQIEERKEKLENDYFSLVDVFESPWQETYTADEYIKLRNTYSDHHALSPAQKLAFEKEIRDFSNKEFGGKITKRYVSVLFLCGKK